MKDLAGLTTHSTVSRLRGLGRYYNERCDSAPNDYSFYLGTHFGSILHKGKSNSQARPTNAGRSIGSILTHREKGTRKLSVTPDHGCTSAEPGGGEGRHHTPTTQAASRS
jgi:hypothetical protein